LTLLLLQQGQPHTTCVANTHGLAQFLKTNRMENFIYVGETVTYHGQKALVFNFELPYVLLLLGDQQKRVRFDEISKIRSGSIINVMLN
jgi:hypothetical protein